MKVSHLWFLISSLAIRVRSIYQEGLEAGSLCGCGDMGRKVSNCVDKMFVYVKACASYFMMAPNVFPSVRCRTCFGTSKNKSRQALMTYLG